MPKIRTKTVLWTALVMQILCWVTAAGLDVTMFPNVPAHFFKMPIPQEAALNVSLLILAGIPVSALVIVWCGVALLRKRAIK